MGPLVGKQIEDSTPYMLEHIQRKGEEAAEKMRQTLKESLGQKQRDNVEAEARKQREREEAELAEAKREAAERAEMARQAEIEQLAKERERKAQVSAFLKKHGYSSVSTPKRTMLKTKYPIHTAAKSGDPQIVSALVQEKLDLTQKDSSGHTALQI